MIASAVEPSSIMLRASKKPLIAPALRAVLNDSLPSLESNTLPSTNGVRGVMNTGSGGGGGERDNYDTMSGAGGSGIVIIAYPS